jgi:membrane protein required for colicin V production
MLILDIVLGLIVLYGACRGFKNGLIVELFGILAWAIGIYGALHFSDWTADQLKPYVSWSENATKTASFVLTFLALLLITHLLAKALTKIASLMLLGGINKIFGVLFGVLKTVGLLALLLAYLAEHSPLDQWVSQEQEDPSKLYEPIKSAGQTLLEAWDFVAEKVDEIDYI